MIDLDAAWESGKTVGGIITAIAAAIGVGFRYRGWILRKSSGDGIVIATNAAEGTILQRALDQAERERKRADEAFAERNKAVEELGRLRGEVEYLRAQVAAMREEIAAMHEELGGIGRRTHP